MYRLWRAPVLAAVAIAASSDRRTSSASAITIASAATRETSSAPAVTLAAAANWRCATLKPARVCKH